MKAYYVYKVNLIKRKEVHSFVGKFTNEEDAVRCCRDIDINPRIWHLESCPLRMYYVAREE